MYEQFSRRQSNFAHGDEFTVRASPTQWLLARFPRSCRLTNRLAFLAMFLFSLSVVMAIVAPQHYRIGPLRVSFDGVLKPVIEWLAAYVVWRSTYDGFGAWLRRWLSPLERLIDRVFAQLRAAVPRLREQWRRWGWRERLVLAAVGCQVLLAVRSWDGYPRQLESVRSASQFMQQYPYHYPGGHASPTLDYFCETIRASTPPDARILFYGRTPAARVAYEVFPRRVFMLPQDYTALAAAWHVQPWCQQFAPDPHIAYWQRLLPHDTVAARTFIHDRGITWIAAFDEYDMNLCRVEAVR